MSAIQRGSNVLLQWPAPSLGQKESSRSYIARVNIYRLDERRDEEPVLDSDDFEAEALLVGYLDRASIEAQLKSIGHLEFTDAIKMSDAIELANRRLRYAVRYVNARDQAAAFSNTVAIEPAPAVSLPPTGVRVAAPAQDLVAVSWGAPDANVDGTRPAAIVGYNVYRRNANNETGGRLLNSEPVTDTNFADKDFQYQNEYAYFVRALSQGANGLIESANSQVVTLKPVDEFAPSAPDPVSIASANGTISLFWPTSPERDVVGYNVYRSDSADTPEKDWIKLTAQPITAVTYRDERVVIDKTYFYSVTAVDRFNNESKPSRVVSETAHP
jgi:fibronectin type 3 domain-containing protein